MYLIRQCLILFGCLGAGELIVWATGIPLPSSIIGMLILTLTLATGKLKLEWIKGLTDILLSNISFFFIPSGVALMLYFDVIEANIVAIATATIVSALLVMLVTGWTHQIITKMTGKEKEERKEGKEEKE